MTNQNPMQKMEILTRSLITTAWLMQLMYLILQKTKAIYFPALITYSLGTCIMIYDMYTIDGEFSARVLHKITNYTILLLIYAFSK